MSPGDARSGRPLGRPRWRRSPGASSRKRAARRSRLTSPHGAGVSKRGATPADKAIEIAPCGSPRGHQIHYTGQQRPYEFRPSAVTFDVTTNRPTSVVRVRRRKAITEPWGSGPHLLLRGSTRRSPHTPQLVKQLLDGAVDRSAGSGPSGSDLSLALPDACRDDARRTSDDLYSTV